MEPFQLDAWCNASWPTGDTRNMARGYWRVRGFRPEQFEFRARSSVEALIVTLRLLLVRFAKERNIRLRIFVSNGSVFKNDEVKALLVETGSALVWIRKARLDSNLGYWLRQPRPGTKQIPEEEPK